MWTEQDISEAVLLGALILGSPLIYAFTKKLASYLLNKYLPRDAVIDYVENGSIVCTYYIKRGLFKKSQVYRLTAENNIDDERHQA